MDFKKFINWQNINKEANPSQENEQEKTPQEKLDEYRIGDHFNSELFSYFYQQMVDSEYEKFKENSGLYETDINAHLTINDFQCNTFSYLREYIKDNKLNDFYKILDEEIEQPIVNAISFNNFKAFGEKLQQFDVKPIMLIYAPNSVGKSSFQHSFVLLHYFALYHTKHEIVSLFKTDEFGDEVDIGGFENYIHKHETNRIITYNIDIDDCRVAYLKGKGYNEKEIMIFFYFQQFIANTDKLKPIIEFFIDIIAKEYDKYIDIYKDFERVEFYFDKVLRRSFKKEDAKDEFLLKLKYLILKAIQEKSDKGIIFEKLVQLIKEHQKQYVDKDAYPNVLLDPSFILKKQPMTIKYNLAKDFHESFYRINDEELEFSSDYVKKEDDEYKKLIQNLDKLVVSKSIQYIGPLRYYPDRNFILENIDDNDLKSYSSVQLWSLLQKRQRVLEDLNAWLVNKDKLKSHYNIKIDKENRTISFLDKRTNTPVSHRDLGLGVSQVLPVLIASYFGRDRTIMIEQPELHLHPAVQAELGDEVIKSFKNGNNHFIIETHSEYLLLRLMRRMRYFANQKEDRDRELDFTSNDISILYIDEDEGDVFVKELRLDDDGKLLDVWPGGFFEEGFKERFL